VMAYGNYADNTSTIWLATSPDGLSWDWGSARPAVRKGAGRFSQWVYTPDLHIRPEGWGLWFGGCDIHHASLAYAFSRDGSTWTPHVDLLDEGPRGSVDDGNIGIARVLSANGQWHMVYSCDSFVFEPYPGNIVYATSPDGINWTRQGVVLPRGEGNEWDSLAVGDQCWLLDGDKLRLWYVGRSIESSKAGRFGIGYAEAPASVLADGHGQANAIPVCPQCGAAAPAGSKFCPKCGARLIAALKPYEEDAYFAANKKKKTEEERAIEQRLLKNANIILSSGKKAVIALSARGVGPENASRILATLAQDDAFYREILKAERTFIQTHRFWT